VTPEGPDCCCYEIRHDDELRIVNINIHLQRHNLLLSAGKRAIATSACEQDGKQAGHHLDDLRSSHSKTDERVQSPLKAVDCAVWPAAFLHHDFV
jgi:hypothetical protein